MSSLAVGRGLGDLELWLGGLFTAAELAAADLLPQLSVAGAGWDDEAAESSMSAMTYLSRRSASPSLDVNDLAAAEDLEAEEPVLVVEETAVPLRSMELDRRARKRYRTLSDLYAATSPVSPASASASVSGAKKTKKRKHGGGDALGSSSSQEETRYGGDH